MQELEQTQEVSDVEVNESQPVSSLSEEQNALLHYQKNMNDFIKLLSNYSGSTSQIRRAWTNAAISPMNKEEFHFSYPEEKQLFDLFNELNSAKFILMVYGMVKEGRLQLLKPLMEMAEEPVTSVENNETVSTQNEENVNGV